MTYTDIISKLQEKGYRPIQRIRIPSADILGLEVYCSPILMDDRVDEFRVLVGDSFKVDKFPNHDYILITKKHQ